MLTTLQAFGTVLKNTLFPPAPRLVGVQTYSGFAYNDLTGSRVPWSADLQLLIDWRGKRVVKASDRALLKERVARDWILWGDTPHGMTIAL